VLPSPAPAKLFACRDGGMFSSSSPRQDNHRLDDERRLVNSFVRSSLTSKQEPVVLIMDDDGSTPIPNLTILSLSMHRAMLLFAQAGNRADLCLLLSRCVLCSLAPAICWKKHVLLRQNAAMRHWL
jgi:hypothetical protein